MVGATNHPGKKHSMRTHSHSSTPDTDMNPAPLMTPDPAPLPARASPLRRLLHAFALDDWFRVVSLPGGAPDRRELWRQGGLSMLWFLSGCLAMYGGFYLFWPIFLYVPFAGWKTLRHWSLTFYMRLKGSNRWLYSNYARVFAGCVRVFAVAWPLYLATTPIRPFSATGPDAEVSAMVERLRASDPEKVKAIEGSLPDTALPKPDFYAITANAEPQSLGRGTTQILRSPFSSFLFGCDHAAQRRIAEARRAWCIAILCTPPAERAAVREKAMRADLAHPVLGRGGLPHLCDHWVFGPRYPLVTGGEKVAQ